MKYFLLYIHVEWHRVRLVLINILSKSFYFEYILKALKLSFVSSFFFWFDHVIEVGTK